MSFDSLGLIIRWILAVLAVYRLAFELAVRAGPFGLFIKWRTLLVLSGHYWLEEWVTCPVCQSLWIAAVAMPVFFMGFPLHSWGEWVLLWLSISGGCLLFHFWLSNVLENGQSK